MSIEILAGAAVYLYKSYINYLNVALNQNGATVPGYTIIKKIKKTTKNGKQKRRHWKLSMYKTRQNMNRQMLELLAEPTGEFWSFVRMSTTDFEYLLEKISPIITKQDTRWRPAIPAKIRLALALRFLTTGESYGSLNVTFKISPSAISRAIPEVCSAINDIFKDLIKFPTCEEEWMSKTEGFIFPHCVGVLDGKHITIVPSSYTGNEYCNYKGSYSIALLSLVDSDYCFTFADVGYQGRISDDDDWTQSVLWQKLNSDNLNLPTIDQHKGINLPYVFLGNEAFPLRTYIIKPFHKKHALPGTPESVFNQHIQRSLSVAENAFGILSTVFKVFKKPIPLDARKSSIITMTCLYLHNFLMRSNTSRDIYSPPGTVDTYANNELVTKGTWRKGSQNNFIQLQSFSGAGKDKNAIETRLNFMNHFYNNPTKNE